jgi:hypothetical protein
MTAPPPRIEVELKAIETCYPSNDPPFYLVLHTTLRNSEERVIFLKDGLVGATGYQPINSNQIIQCFDNETGEQVPILHQGPHSVFLNSYIRFTTSKTRQSNELPFINSSLQPGRKHRQYFKPTTFIPYWPVSTRDALSALEGLPNDSITVSDIPTPSTPAIPWTAADGNDTIVFETRSPRPKTPNVTVSLSAPSTYSLCV